MRRLALVAVVALAFPASAFAHANLDSTSPTYRQRLQAPPRAVVLRFDQSVQAQPNAIEVRSAFGKILSGAAHAQGPTVRVPLKRLPRGAYTVRWHVLSEDGHVVSGVFTFGVRVKAPPPTEAYGASGPTTTEHVVRWAYFLSLALLLGGPCSGLRSSSGSASLRASRCRATLPSMQAPLGAPSSRTGRISRPRRSGSAGSSSLPSSSGRRRRS